MRSGCEPIIHAISPRSVPLCNRRSCAESLDGRSYAISSHVPGLAGPSFFDFHGASASSHANLILHASSAVTALLRPLFEFLLITLIMQAFHHVFLHPCLHCRNISPPTPLLLVSQSGLWDETLAWSMYTRGRASLIPP